MSSEARDGDDPAVIRWGGQFINTRTFAETYPFLMPHLIHDLVRVALSYRSAYQDPFVAYEKLCFELHMMFAVMFDTYLDSRKKSLAKAARMQKVRIPRRLRKQVFDRDDYACVKCGSRFEIACDHVHPESKGGPTTLDNLQTLCKSCNSRKGAKVEPEFLIPQIDLSILGRDSEEV